MTSEQRVTLEYLAEQQRRMLTGQRALRDEMLLQGAIIRNTTQGLLDRIWD